MDYLISTSHHLANSHDFIDEKELLGSHFPSKIMANLNKSCQNFYNFYSRTEQCMNIPVGMIPEPSQQASPQSA